MELHLVDECKNLFMLHIRASPFAQHTRFVFGLCSSQRRPRRVTRSDEHVKPTKQITGGAPSMTDTSRMGRMVEGLEGSMIAALVTKVMSQKKSLILRDTEYSYFTIRLNGEPLILL